MTWDEIKRTPRYELQGILAACYEYNDLHSMDGYDSEDISSMAKDKPAIRAQWNRYMEKRRKYETHSEKNESVAAINALKTQLNK